MYQASNLGNIRIKENDTFEFVETKNKKGYLQVSLLSNGLRERHLVHRIIALTFIGERPKGYHTCHNNGVKTDNRIFNLRYDTPLGNRRDTYTHAKKRRLCYKIFGINDIGVNYKLL